MELFGADKELLSPEGVKLAATPPAAGLGPAALLVDAIASSEHAESSAVATNGKDQQPLPLSLSASKGAASDVKLEASR